MRNLLVIGMLLIAYAAQGAPPPGTEVSPGKFFWACVPAISECAHSNIPEVCAAHDQYMWVEDPASECQEDVRMPVGCFCVSDDYQNNLKNDLE